MESRFESWTEDPAQGLRHLTGLRGIRPETLRSILERARAFRSAGLHAHSKLAEGRQAALLFYENSTRTRMSFESALYRLGAQALVLTESTSSATKGESLRDTVRNLEAMGIEMIIMRHPDPDSAEFVASEIGIPVVNGGAGAAEHPTQALFDILTMEDALGDLRGKRIAIVGDIAHSRVVRSNLFGLRSLGASVVLCGPPTLVSPRWRELGADVTDDLREALSAADAVMALRLQSERLAGDQPGSPGMLRSRYGITGEVLKRYPDLKVMHPGPVVRGMELSHDAADAPQSLILEQVRNSIFVRMAVVAMLFASNPPHPAQPVAGAGAGR